MKNRLIVLIPGLLAASLWGGSLHAQAIGSSKEFVPYPNVIFKDDLGKELNGTFPSLWEDPPDSKKYGWSVNVVEHPDGNFIAVSTLPYNTGTLSLEPRINDLDYLDDSFTIDFEFYLENNASKIDVDFYSSTREDVFELIFHTIVKKEKKNWLLEYSRWYNTTYNEQRKLPAGFIFNNWHRFALSYAHEELRCYIDDDKYLAVQGHDHELAGMFFSFSQSVNLKNIRVATGRPKERKQPTASKPVKPANAIPANITQPADNPLNKILTDNIFISHDINFDINRSTIRPESMEFISRLATFLKANPSVTLEIDGHTDSDGEEEANMKLSQERADEVKKQLVAMGINAARLTTKGFGESVPLKPNTTVEGKAENRRVEFIKR